ncbi:hypothetical protein BHQ23_02310 [Mycobacterium gordonae]|uniref:Uncharacterized protein n=1 Tax=Mycobacterium gordonae TaxID=1778 RepID=A0A1A6BFG2_MYCGO|nr:hypothetical protein A9W98_22350 [Mycobacterium gordonae]ODR24084.1 hypothetical protein BHQ23_02310 [Mycobacterium gordonae]ORV68424.1 hypothetical protein AWC08_07330 [Mycobacterium gordonae]
MQAYRLAQEKLIWHRVLSSFRSLDDDQRVEIEISQGLERLGSADTASRGSGGRYGPGWS